MTGLTAALMSVYGAALGAPAVEVVDGSNSSAMIPYVLPARTDYSLEKVTVNVGGFATGTNTAVASTSATSLVNVTAGGNLTLDGATIDWTGGDSNNSNSALRVGGGGQASLTGGTISTSGGIRKIGMSAIDGGVINASNLTITTSGNSSAGVQAFRTYSNPTAGDTPTLVNLDSVNIFTGGSSYSVGIRADHKGAGVVGNNVNITTSAAGSYGVEVNNGATVALTGGSITTAGDYAGGVRAYTGTGAKGLLGAGKATVNGTVIETSGNYASGLIAGDAAEPTSGLIDAVNASITTKGNYAAALESAYGSTVTSQKGTLRTEGF